MRRFLAILTFVAACGGATEPEAAADPCANWNTQRFSQGQALNMSPTAFRTVSDVTGRNEDLQFPICMAAQFASDTPRSSTCKYGTVRLRTIGALSTVGNGRVWRYTSGPHSTG